MHNRLKILLGGLLGLALIYWFAKDLDGRAVLETIKGANWWLLAAAALLTIATYFVRAVRWRTLLEPISPGVSLSNLTGATSLGFLAVFVFGRTGEIVRPVALSSKEHVRPSASFATILIERVFDMLTVVAFFAIDMLIFTAPKADATMNMRFRLSGAILMGLAVTTIVGLVLLRRYRAPICDFLNRHLDRFGRRLRRAVVSFVDHFAESIAILHDARELVVVSGQSLVLWIICAVVNQLVFYAFGLNLSLGEALFVLGFGLIGSLVPTPGGAAGAFHMATAAGLMFLGSSENDAKSIAIVLHLVVFGSAFPVGLYYLVRGGYSMGRLRAALSEDLNSIPDFDVGAGYEPSIGALGAQEELKADR